MKGEGVLEKKLTLILLLFAAVISGTMWAVGYNTYMDSTLSKYKSVAESVLNLARSFIDADDMMKCLETGVKSETYKRTQASLDKIKENMNLSYLYLFDVTPDGKILYFLNAVTARERELSAGAKINSLGDKDEFPGKVTRQLLRESYLEQNFTEIVNRTQYGYMLSVYSPMKDLHEDPIGLIGVDFDMNKINAELKSYAVTVAAGAVAVTFAFTALLIWFVRRNVTGPISVIAEKAGEFAAVDSFGNELSAIKLNLKKGDEIEVLASAFEKMTEDMVRYVLELKVAVAEQERVESELGVARSIQAGVLPTVFPAFPDRDEFGLYASMTPEKGVGGDFYDFFMTDESHVALVIADVSGAGVPAALFMMVARTLIKNEIRSGDAPNEALERVNRALCENNSACMFVTAFVCSYDTRTGSLKYANAGHNPPLVIKSDGGSRELENPPSLILAVDETARYSSREIALEPGDCVLLYTDGVTEAFNDRGEMFSEAGLAGAVNFPASGGDRAREVIERISGELQKFTRDAEQSDDITMLTLARRR